MNVSLVQTSSEHPLARAILEYASHFHEFDEPNTTKNSQTPRLESKSFGWLLDASDFSALPGQGVQCFIGRKKILVSFLMATPYV